MLPTHRPVQDLATLIAATPEDLRQMVSATIIRHAQHLADQFYSIMLDDEQASKFLSSAIVGTRLKPSLVRWLCDIYAPAATGLDALIAQQRRVGEVHARIHLPIHLVARGARHLKAEICAALETRCPDPARLIQAYRYASQRMDMALEIMSMAYEAGAERESRTDEAFRQHALGLNMAAERERQRSSLLEWGQNVLLMIYRQARGAKLPRITASEFGLWLVHKGSSIFEGSPELAEIRAAMERVDEAILPRLQREELSSQGIGVLLGDLEAEVEAIKFQLASLFDRLLEVEHGRDTLTRLFNRRFLPSVISREIGLASKGEGKFALLLIDLDHFKRINDEHGHDAGDMVLQQVATLLLNAVRGGDFVFRYGGEELLVVLVEVDRDEAERIAEKLRGTLEGARLLIGQGKTVSITASIGLAQFDGHPDYQYLIRRADEAMYRAKHEGRNQVRSA